MTAEISPSLAWVIDFSPLFGATPDLLLEPVIEDPDVPKFHYGDKLPAPRTVSLRTYDKTQAWRGDVAAALQNGEWRVCMTNLIGIPLRSIAGEIQGNALFDAAAFLAEMLKHPSAGKLMVALAPRTILVNQTFSYFREWLGKTHQVQSIVYLGRESAQLIGAHPEFRLAILVIRSGRSESDPVPLVRLIDVANSPRAEWISIARAAAKRGGGEVGSSIVLRNATLDGTPWTYERFSRSFEATLQDAARLGRMRPLRELVSDITAGIHRTVEAKRVLEVVDLDENANLPHGAIACFSGRSIDRDGKLLNPAYAVPLEGLPERMFLQKGDVLVRTLIGRASEHKAAFAAIVPEEVLPAAFDQSCIRIRWRKDVSRRAALILTGYLNSTHVRKWLIANGAGIAVNVDTLNRLEMPDPSTELLDALETLADAERQYQEWAEEVAAVRQEFFATATFAEQLPVLLDRQRTEVERLRAARDASGLDYRIRNHYPHAIALRRATVLQTQSGEARIKAILECAEHLLTFLAILAILQDSSVTSLSGPVVTRLRSFVRDGSLHLDWGKSVTLLQEGVNFTARHPNPLALPFPQLVELAASIADESSSWCRAERNLREWRNKQAHLERRPESDLTEVSDMFLEDLNALLEAASFISTLPLVYVEDYELDAINGTRFATFQLLEGVSPVFQRSRRQVQRELPRGAVGFLSQRDEFLSALPWLTMERCPVCKRAEVFVFNRYTRTEARYIAMETGHARDNRTLSTNIGAVILPKVQP